MIKTKYVLMSIKPCYAQLIKTGEKTVELRRVAPKITSGDFIVIYESKPVQRITAICEVESSVDENARPVGTISKSSMHH